MCFVRGGCVYVLEKGDKYMYMYSVCVRKCGCVCVHVYLYKCTCVCVCVCVCVRRHLYEGVVCSYTTRYTCTRTRIWNTELVNHVH